jgi:hypothetical protein
VAAGLQARERLNSALKSFHLELVANALFKRSPRFVTVDAIEAFFDELSRYVAAPHFPDRADSSRYVDKYLEELKADERADIEARIKAARSHVAAMIAAETEADARRSMVRVLAGGTVVAAAVAVAAPAVAKPAAATTYTPASSFQPPRNYADTYRR